MGSKKYKTLVIGIDQSYKNTGISMAAEGILLAVKSIQLDKLVSNSTKREKICLELIKALEKAINNSEEVICVIERIRLRSKGFLNINYIKSIGALNAVIIDVCYKYGVKVYSVDTRCWKAQVVGTSKPQENKYGVQPEKWPTIKWVINKGFKDKILIKVKGRKTKGTFIENGVRYKYNDDAADSAAISMFYFVGDRNKLEEER
jgi:Holliday junction resolvasome RuvABC endonuclease subunit